MDSSLPRHDDISSMIPVEEARERILSRIEPLAPLDLPLAEAFGCVLAHDVAAKWDLPPFASSAMDGFAARAADVASASSDRPASLKIVGRAMIGRHPEATVGPGEAVSIATGAPIPTGADCVVPIEDTHLASDRVEVLYGAAPGRHVRPAGEEAHSGDLLAAAGRRIGAPELGLLASAGYARAPVFPRPRVVVISTGDELVEPGKPLEFGQIHESNAYMLTGTLKEAGAQPFLSGVIADDPATLRSEVLSQLSSADVLISTGGVSVGERDPVKGAFRDRGEVEFYRVAMQPGMPQGFGLIEGKPFFCLPGNPVSVFVSFEVFVRPALMRMMSRSPIDRPHVSAVLTDDLNGPVGKTVFARVAVRREAGRWTATPSGGRGSNLIGSVARANGLAVIPPGTGELSAGTECRVMIFRSSEDQGG